MKLASYTIAQQASYGVVTDEGIVDVGAVLRPRYADLKAALTDLGAIAHAMAHAPLIASDECALLPPVPNAGRIICVGLNYKTHIDETGRDRPSYPVLFARYPDSLVGSGAPLVVPRASPTHDFEGEMAFVIGKPGRHIQKAEALQHVAGYAGFNDGSIREFQRHTSQFLPGKSFRHSGAFGPYLVTRDEIPDVGALKLETRLNGSVMQEASIGDLLFGVEDLIEYLSTVLLLQPGDVVATGTTGGVGEHRDPPVWLQAGDLVEVEITGLGTLRNPVVAE